MLVFDESLEENANPVKTFGYSHVRTTDCKYICHNELKYKFTGD